MAPDIIERICYGFRAERSFFRSGRSAAPRAGFRLWCAAAAPTAATTAEKDERLADFLSNNIRVFDHG
jgi:hypothetical protein